MSNTNMLLYGNGRIRSVADLEVKREVCKERKLILPRHTTLSVLPVDGDSGCGGFRYCLTDILTVYVIPHIWRSGYSEKTAIPHRIHVLSTPDKTSKHRGHSVEHQGNLVGVEEFLFQELTRKRFI